MRKLWMTVFLAAHVAAAQSVVTPDLVDGVSFIRGQSAVVPGQFQSGKNLILTNCTIYADWTGTVVQSLATNTYTLDFYVAGYSGSSTSPASMSTNRATPIGVATSGLFWVQLTIPTNSSTCKSQPRLNTNDYSYPVFQINLQESL